MRLPAYITTFLFLVIISGCGKKETTDNKAGFDSTMRAKSDTVTTIQNAQQIKVKGFSDTTVEFSDYIEKHPNLKNQVEFEELISMLAVNKSDQSGRDGVLQQWEILADKNTSPVNWLTSGGGQARVGEIIIKINGKPVETLDTYLRPAIWRITLSGTKSGVNKADLDCDELTGKLGHIDVPALLKKNKFQCDLIKSTGDASTGEQHYQLSAPGKETSWLLYEWSCGSGGCSADFTLYYNKNTYDRDNKLTP